MNHKLALDILLATHDHLASENEVEEFSIKDKFLCNAITNAARKIPYDQQSNLFDRTRVVEALRNEVTAMIGGYGHVREFMSRNFGVSHDDMPASFTQPIRRGMLNKLIAKYQKLNGLYYNEELV